MATTNGTSSASSYSYLQTSNGRFSGLASGMDIDSIVEKLMKAEAAKMEKLQQQKQKYEWQRDAYRSVNTKLETFRTDAFDKYAPSTFAAKTASVSDSRVSATATSDATGTLNISSVSSLATATQTISDEVKITENGAERLVKGTDSLGSLGLTTGSFTMKVVQKNGSTVEKTVNYDENESIDTFVKNLNSAGLGVTAMFGNGKLSLTSNTTGEYDDGTIAVDNGSTELFTKLGFGNKMSTNPSGTINLGTGTDAQYVINGIEKSAKTNSFAELGYNVTLNSTFTDSGTPVTISSNTDTEKIVDQVKSFVKMYNDLIGSFNTSIGEKKNYDYAPLTDAQRSAMSESQINTWEEKAKKGLLRGDSSISKVLSEMRTTLYSTQNVDSPYNALYKIGITTSATYTDNGKLEIDEDALRAAINDDADAVASLFGRAEGSNGAADKGGVINQLRAIAKTGIDTITKKAGKDTSVETSYTLGKNISSLTTKIDEWKDKLKTIEERYYKQFTAMETAISNANTQSSLFA
jgi:flagellar hook-associated protein 2